MNEPALIREVLDNSSLWFIVGLGNNPSRVAFGVSRTIAAHGKRVVPIHPRAESVHGEPGFTSIAEAAAVHGAPDVVDMFVNSDRVGALTDQALAVGAKAVWFQLGVIDYDAAKRVDDAGVTMIMDRCPAIEWSR
ncbi:MAG: CoA-binding protein [Actinomycetes bacterium]|jgi:predicted CoA-binding protein